MKTLFRKVAFDVPANAFDLPVCPCRHLRGGRRCPYRRQTALGTARSTLKTINARNIRFPILSLSNRITANDGEKLLAIRNRRP